jgi:hypothetical protein
MDEAMEQRWRELSEEVLSGMKEWRFAHPKATLQEIEEAAAERMSRLEAQLIQGTALSSQKRTWSHLPEEEQPRCKVCELILRERGEHTRKLQGKGGKEITLKRQYGTCPFCGAGLFPPG